MGNKHTQGNLDRLPCGIIEVSQQRDIIFCNRYALKLLAAKAHQVVGQRLARCMSAASNIFIDSYVYPLLLNESEASEVQLTLQRQGHSKVPVVANIIAQENGASTWA